MKRSERVFLFLLLSLLALVYFVQNRTVRRMVEQTDRLERLDEALYRQEEQKDLLMELRLALSKSGTTLTAEARAKMDELFQAIDATTLTEPLREIARYEEVKKMVSQETGDWSTLSQRAERSLATIWNGYQKQSEGNYATMKGQMQVLREIKETNRRFTLILLLLAFFSLLYIGYILKKRLFTFFLTLGRMTKKLADRDLALAEERQYLDSMVQHSMGEIFVYLKAIVHTMEKFIASLKKAGNKLSSASIDIQESTKQQATVINEEAASLNEITTSVEELSITAKEIADIAAEVDAVAGQGKTMAKKGGDVIETMTSSVNTVHESILGTARQNIETVEQSKKIDSVLSVMEDVATEIHLLALNASIESAGAGEAGKRFGVIAQEIRELADNSKNSIDTIRKQILDFHNSLNTSVLSIEVTSHKVSEMSKVVKEAGHYFKELFALIDQSALYAKNISGATAQQKIASEQVVAVMRDVSNVINLSANEVTKINASVDQLMDVSLIVNSLINTFKTDDKRAIRNILEEIREAPEVVTEEYSKLAPLFQESLRLNSFLEAIYLADAKGHLVELIMEDGFKGDVEELKKVNPLERDWFKNAMLEKEVAITSPYLSLATGELCITFSVPVILNGDSRSVIGIDVNYKRWIRDKENEL